MCQLIPLGTTYNLDMKMVESSESYLACTHRAAVIQAQICTVPELRLSATTLNFSPV